MQFVFFALNHFSQKTSLFVTLLDEIMKKVKEAGFSISKVKEKSLTREMAAQFYKDHEGKPFFEELVNCMTE